MRRPAFLDTPFWRNFGAGITLGVTGIAVLVVSLVLRSGWDAKLEKAEADYMVQINQSAVEQQQQSGAVIAEEDRIRYGVTGVDSKRQRTDDLLMSDVFGYATTWSSSREYESKRASLLQKYDWLDEGSQFLSGFFPPVSAYGVIRDTAGNVVVNYLDDGRNIRFVSLRSNVVSVDGDVYSYVAEITTQSSGLAGGSATGRILATYAVDGDGRASDIRLYVISA